MAGKDQHGERKENKANAAPETALKATAGTTV
jgi:hypothetical protein